MKSENKKKPFKNGLCVFGNSNGITTRTQGNWTLIRIRNIILNDVIDQN